MILPPFEHPHPLFGSTVGTNLETLRGVMDALGSKRVFLVTGKQSYEQAPVAAKMKGLLEGLTSYRHCNFDVNPHLDDLLRGVDAFRAFNPDLLIALGGGSVIDTAKLLPVLPNNEQTAAAILKGNQTALTRACPFIALPTTAGSGSEATQFAVVYIGTHKYSVDHPVLKPDYVVLDPSLTDTLSPYLTATTGMDALSQAIESHWAQSATPESQALASQAITTLLSVFPRVVNHPTATARQQMLEGAYLAGKAINKTRTTAPHALSYRISQLYHIPHGHAVGVTLPAFFAYNLSETATRHGELTPTLSETITTLKGATKSEAETLCRLLGCADVAAGKALLESLMDEAGLKRRFTDLGATRPSDVDQVVAAVNLQRLANNPKPLDATTLKQLLLTLW